MRHPRGPMPYLRAVGEFRPSGVILWRSVWRGDFPALHRSRENARRRRQILAGSLRAANGVGILFQSPFDERVKFVPDYLAAVSEAAAEENPRVIVLGRKAA